jgi:hypothetical protein
MTRRVRRQFLACFAVAAYLVAGSGLTNQLVYCIGADGHRGVEQAHETVACKTVDSRVASDKRSIAPDSCTDVPLLVQASKEERRVSSSSLRCDAVATTVAAIEPTSAFGLRRARAAKFRLQDTASLQITVLRV